MGCLTSRLLHRSAVHRLEDPVLISDEAPGNHMYTAVALCNFSPRRSDEHTILLGDRLHIISEDNGMLTVRSTSTGPEFFIPHNYVSKVHNRSMVQSQLNGSNQESLVSEGLRETMKAYFYVTESSECED
ncbi:hypothetical protein cypCar_00013550 [Cyprinus carpio]|nr:hypothetical protein cypCar_00013550 [Cyprinus carpio]